MGNATRPLPPLGLSGSQTLRRDLELVAFLGAFGAVAASLTINIPHTPLYIEVRWLFGYLGAVLIRRFWPAFLLTLILSFSGPAGDVPIGIKLCGNLSYALPFTLMLRWVYRRWLAELKSAVACGAGWFLAVLAGYQLFTTPLTWMILLVLKGTFSWSGVLESFALQPYFEESLAVGIPSALALVALRMHAALRQNERHLAITLDSIGDAVIATDAHGTVQRMNPVAEDLCGWSLSEAAGRPLTEVFTIHNTITGEPLVNPAQQVLREGVTVGLANHTTLVSRYGIEYQIADSAAPIRDAEDNILGVVMVFRDVTADYAARNALRQSEERYRLLAENLPLPVNALDLGYNFSFWNKACEAITGYTAEEILGNPRAGELLYPDPAYRERLAREFTDDGGFQGREMELTCKDGSRRSVCWYNLKTPFMPGRDTWAVGVDVTDRRQAEEQLRFHSMVLDQIADLVTVTDLEGRILYVNDAEVRRLGRPTEEIIGQNVALYGEAPDQGATQQEIIDTTLHKGEWQGEVINFDHEGHRVLLLCRTRLVYDVHGQPVAMCGISTDITALKEAEESLRDSEERWHFALEGAGDGVWDWHVQSDKVFFSAQWKAMLGYGEEEIGDRLAEWENRVHPDDLARAEAELASHLHGETPCYESEHRLRCKDGSYKWILDRGKVVQRDEQGRPLRVIGTHSDITQRHQMQERLRQSEKMEAIGQLAGGVAHDFNNQLAGIMGYADILLRKLDNDKQITYAERIVGAAQRAADLTGQLLAFARKGQVQHVPVDLHRTIADVVSMLEHTIDRRIAVAQHLRAHQPLTQGDPTQLQNALLNLGLNARDAMPEGGTLTFSTEQVTLDEGDCRSRSVDLVPGGYIEVRVADTGIGMDEEVRQRLFEPFFTTKPEGAGTGMGLAAVYGTLQAHHGSITVYSESGHGAEFILLLPAAPLANATSEPETVAPPAPGEAGILLVDDEEDIRLVTSELLREAGYQVWTATDGAEALKVLAQNRARVDLVILDMVMPNMSGRECWQALRAANPDIRVLLASGFSLNAETQAALNEGVQGFIQKPFRHTALLQAVRQALGA